MRKTYAGIVMALLSLCHAPLMSQPSGFTDDFTALDEGWAESNNDYTISVDGGALKLDVHKSQVRKYIAYSMPEDIDILDNPFVNVRTKGDKPFVLSIYLKSGGNVTGQSFRVESSDDYIDVFLHYTDVGFVKLDEISDYWVVINDLAYDFNGTVWIDEIKMGTDAQKLAGITGIEDQVIPPDVDMHHIRATEIKNATEVTVSGGKNLIENLQVSGIRNGIANITFEPREGASGTETMTVTAHGAKDYLDNPVHFDLTVSENAAPGLNDIDDIEVAVGTETAVPLSGITDGDPSADQELSFTISSDDQTALPDGQFKIAYEDGSPYGTLTFTAQDPGEILVTVVLQDDGSGTNQVQKSFYVYAYNNLNTPPVMNPIEDLRSDINDGSVTVPLSGIGDGEGGSQVLSYDVTSSNQTVLPDASISMNNWPGPGAELLLDYQAAGTTTVTLSISDDGAGMNNGSKTADFSFELEVYEPLPTGYVVPMNPGDETGGEWTWHNLQVYNPTIVDSGSFNCMVIECNNKFYWDGYNLVLTESSPLNLSEHRYLSMEVYSIGKATLHWIWFYDDTGIRNDVTNRDESNMFWAPAGKWTRIFFDFSQESDMLNKSTGEEINTENIQRVLFNIHDADFGWPPPPDYTGTFLIRNVRLGSEAEIPDVTPVTTIDPVGDIVLFEGPGTQLLKLTGISDGDQGLNTPTVSAVSSNPSFIPNPSVSAVSDGSAELTFTPTAALDTATITLTVTATGSDSKVISFFVETKSSEAADGSAVNVDITQRFQEIHGFGTYMNSPTLTRFYVDSMGGSAMRVGQISNQLEPVNDNNDPYVLNREALNYNAFNWDYFRDLKARGVETFILTVWSPPAWTKENLSIDYYRAQAPDYENTTNRLLTHMYEEYAENLVALITLFKEEAGIEIQAVGPQNEPAFNEPYPSAVLDPSHFVSLITVIGKRFEKEGLETQIYMPEQIFSQQHYSMAEYMTAVRNNPEANKYTDIIATHGYASDGIGSGQPDYAAWTTMYDRAQQGDYPKELWMTETYRAYNSYDDAMWIAAAIHGALEYGNIGLWTQWSFEGQHVVNGKPSSMLYACKNYFNFVRPGARRVLTNSENANLLASSYIHEEDGTFTTVVVNLSRESHTAYISGELLPAEYRMYRTSILENCVDVGMTRDSLVIVPPRSVVTLVAQGNRAPTIDQADDMTLDKDPGEQSIILTGISDGDDEISQNVNLTVSTDNETLLPEFNPGSLTDGQVDLSFTPASGETGTAEVTITVTDDGTGFGFNSTQMSFTVNVWDGFNHPPVIDPIPRYYMYEDEGEQSVMVTGLGDGDGGTQSLSVSITSSYTALIANPVFSNNGDGTGTISFTPEEDAYAASRLTVTVTDNGGTAQNNGDQSVETEFLVDVAPVNDPPYMNPVNEPVAVPVNGAVQEVNLTGISDGDDFGPAQSLYLTASTPDTDLLKDIAVTFNPNDGTGILSFQPVTGQEGEGVIELYLSDDGGIANGGVDSAKYVVNVTVGDVDGINTRSIPGVRVYPNPVKEVLNVELSRSIERLFISDLSGRMVLMREMAAGERSVQLELHNLARGSYIFNVVTPEGIENTMIIKE